MIRSSAYLTSAFLHVGLGLNKGEHETGTSGNYCLGYEKQ